MIHLDEARRIVRRHTPVLGTERRSLLDAAGGVLAERVTARHPMPRFDSSAVDGYAVRTRDFAGRGDAKGKRFPLLGTQHAGDTRRLRLRRGGAVRILTGAMVPLGADAVIMQEYSRPAGGSLSFTVTPRPGENIRRRGEEFAAGRELVPVGTIVTPPVVGLLASTGRTSVRVRRRPQVALITTGDELEDAGHRLRAGHIADSNTPALSAELGRLGIPLVLRARAKDSPRSLQSTFRKALTLADAVVTVGGVSVGDHDLVRGVFASLGVRGRFWRIAIKPGKPVFFGTRGRTPVFGLPGNPVGAILMFHLLVAPALRMMMGYPATDQPVTAARLSVTLRKRTDRLELVRGIVSCSDGGVPSVRPAQGQESHMLGGLAAANCLILFPGDRNIIRRNRLVNIMVLPWSENR